MDLINQLSRTSPSLVVDGGNLLFSSSLPKPVPAGRGNNAAIIAQAYLAPSQALVAVGPYDLAGGTELLLQLARQFPLRLLSANLVDQTTAEPLFSPYQQHHLGELRITVIGLTGPALNGAPAGSRILSWEEVLTPLITKTDLESDLTVLLSSYPPKENLKIARRFPTIQILVQSGHAPANRPPRLVENTLICQTGSRGQYQGVLEVEWKGSGRWHHDTRREQARLAGRLKIINQRIAALEGGEADSLDRQLADTLLAREELSRQLDQLRAQQAETPLKGMRYRNRFIALSARLGDDPDTAALITTLQKKRKEAEQAAED
ncbi:bifunctional UDP-sugar hydrolase/5'-nucleotidase [Desulfogranum mediterraneum]|uniref:hypothetical protein n=1 Tax=Desulfogranum mediterraneum TaxID=160661 RepID=UPI0004154909|nr:hypothetical protein [Desulfogranum mediterraneum]